MQRKVDILAWAGVVAFVAWCMAPVWGDASALVLGPYGGADPMLQMGLLQWACLHWFEPSVWLDLPIFHPVPGMLGGMDSMLGQAWLVGPLHLLFAPTAAAQYNLAMVGSLLASALAMATLWRATRGSWQGSGVAALAMVAAPYTISQLGHLNQLPPPAVLLAFAAVLQALKRQEERRRAWPWWCAVGASIALQTAWGWYGFAYSVIGVVMLAAIWFVRRVRAGDSALRLLGTTLRSAAAPALGAVALVALAAQPQLRLADRYPSFTRSSQEVRIGSADIQHLVSRGAYSSSPADWIGRGQQGAERYQNKTRPALSPGWIALALALYGWRRRRELAPGQRQVGIALLAVGVLGLAFAFGDSVGLPGTDRRLPLPLEWLRTVVPSFRAFRAAWRFSWLFVIAVAWWAAYGTWLLAALRDRRRALAPVGVVLLLLVSVPMGIPAARAVHDGRPAGDTIVAPPGPVLALPATFNEFGEDQTEARWLLRALELDRPVTGGATGWVPPEIVAFRERLFRCETGAEDVGAFLSEMRARGYALAEVVLREGDEARTTFWRQALLASGATRVENGGAPGLETYRLQGGADRPVE